MGDFELSAAVGDGHVDEMVLAREQIDLHRERFAEHRPEEYVEQTAGEAEIGIRTCRRKLNVVIGWDETTYAIDDGFQIAVLRGEEKKGGCVSRKIDFHGRLQ